MDLPICDTFLTATKIEHLIRNCGKFQSNGGHKLIDIKAEIAVESEGYTSKLLRAKLRWSNDNGDEKDQLPKSIVIKVIGASKLVDVFSSMPKETLDEFVANVNQAHDIECSIYGLKTLRDTIPMAQCYGFLKTGEDESGVIILEDLSQFGLTLPMRTFGLGLSEASLDNILDVLTSVQAWSLNTDENWRAIVPTTEGCLGSQAFVQMLKGYYDSAALANPEVFAKVDKSKFDEYTTTERYLDLYGGDSLATHGLPMVLIHGDIHTMNMLFERKTDDREKAGDRIVALIDWQVAHQGCGLEDLARLFICMSIEQRRRCKDDILKRYVELFNGKLQNSKDRITFEKVKKAFDDMFAYLGILWICFLGVQDQFLSKMQGNEEERESTRKRFIAMAVTMYEDAVQILGW